MPHWDHTGTTTGSITGLYWVHYWIYPGPILDLSGTSLDYCRDQSWLLPGQVLTFLRNSEKILKFLTFLRILEKILKFLTFLRILDFFWEILVFRVSLCFSQFCYVDPVRGGPGPIPRWGTKERTIPVHQYPGYSTTPCHWSTLLHRSRTACVRRQTAVHPASFVRAYTLTMPHTRVPEVPAQSLINY